MIPMATWVRADSRIPITEMTSITTVSTVPRMRLSHLSPVGAPNTASMFGPSATTGLSVPISVPATISQPVRNPR
jgi:hypothetical protein